MSNLTLYATVWIISVIVMTLFSKIISHLSKKEYREPIILSKLISGHSVDEDVKSIHLIMGWLIHFIIGAIFLFIYIFLWRYSEQIKTVLGTLIVGFLFGVAGVFGWSIIFKLYSKAIKIDVKGYFLQLIFAHIFFCLSAMLLLNKLLL